MMRRVIESLVMELVKDSSIIPPAMVLFLFEIHPAKKGNINKHFTMSFLGKTVWFREITAKEIPDSLEREDLGEQSTENQQLQSSHVQAMSEKV